jgi:hypothetical protein
MPQIKHIPGKWPQEPAFVISVGGKPISADICVAPQD